ncbi:MAG: hypothetical protein D6814_06360 [Calditrichaeota bacterium]|nr:MAG: hypothetical protein D6814_06360 [Calditrichota bacterium]
MIKANARNKLTAEDIEFIGSTLGRNQNARAAVTALVSSPEERDKILDAPELFERILTDASMSHISPFLYFYVLIRHVLQEFSIEDREVADYLASMLTEFSKVNRIHMISQYHQKQYRYLVDLLNDLLDADPEQEFYIQSHVGNYSMFLAGVFPDFIYYRAKYGKMAPDFSYYEQMGSAGYQQAARNRLAERWHLARILEILGTHFRQVRLALNHMVDHYMQLNRNPQSMDAMMRRVQSFIDDRKRFTG